MAHVQKHLKENDPGHLFCEGGGASNTMSTHLAAITATGAVDTTGYGNDPYELLQRGHLLAGEAGNAKMATQLKPSVFLREELPRSQHLIARSMLGPFGSKLLKLKLKSEDELYLHMNMGRPRVTYFEEDRPLMKQVLEGMKEAFANNLDRHVEAATELLRELSESKALAAAAVAVAV